MLNRFTSFFKRNSGGDEGHEDIPWLNGPSIYEHILAHLDPETGRLLSDSVALPDEARFNRGSSLKWAPGAMDGVLGHHVASHETDSAHALASHTINIASNNRQEDKIALYELLLEPGLLGVLDPALQEIVQSGCRPYPHVHDFARFLAESAPDRGPVKFGIALLGVIRDADAKDIVAVLGVHDEFTLFSTVALTNMLPEPELELWSLAQKVDGWGRIHLVERLAATDSPEIKDWLLRDGFRNSIMYEYLAYTCATSGDLRAALASASVDDELLQAAGEIIPALILGGPAEDINDYQDAAFVIGDYLRLIEPGAGTLTALLAVDSILGYLTDDAWDEHERTANGWTSENRTLAIRVARDILRNPRWRPMVEEGLASPSESEFYLADRGADILGLETWDVHWARLQEQPLKAGRWYNIMRLGNQENIQMILDFAVAALPLEQVATGPADELGIGPDFEIHSCLGYVLQELRYYPGSGWPLIAAGLRSPVVRNRNTALAALSAWNKIDVTGAIQQALEEAFRAEPRDDVKKKIQELLDNG